MVQNLPPLQICRPMHRRIVRLGKYSADPRLPSFPNFLKYCVALKLALCLSHPLGKLILLLLVRIQDQHFGNWLLAKTVKE